MTTESFSMDTLPVASILTCLVTLGGWIGTSLLQRAFAQTVPLKFVAYAARGALAWCFWMATLHLMTTLVQTADPWPHWFLALSATIASELVLDCYSATQQLTGSPSLRNRLITRSMPLLRVGLIGLLSILLLEPFISHQDQHEDRRTVAVLVDESDSMQLSSRSASDGGLTRREVSQRLLAGSDGKGQGLLGRLAEDYQLRLYRFGSTARPIAIDQWRNSLGQNLRSAEVTERWSASTEIAAALQQVDGDLPLESLSGVVLLSDGCDHSSTDPQLACRRLIQNKIPVSTVVIGSQTPVRDAQIVALQAPPQVFLGDSVALRAIIKVDQFPGQTAKVNLLKDGQKIDQKMIKIIFDRHRETVLFRHQPTDEGIHEYVVEIEPLPEEENLRNNQATQAVTVSKDHLHLLVIDDRPRWEFRYLRNLFNGRDRTVQLQAVLLHPDHLANVADPPVLPASALRSFDDCDATALPATLQEWLRFDVIVLGDVSREQLGPTGMQALEMFVKNRGGTLIVIAGQNYMPHAYANTPLADLLPVKLDRAVGETAHSPDERFYFAPAADAQSHAILQQVGAGLDTLAMSFPELSWRHPAGEAKTGATVLGYASPSKLDGSGPTGLAGTQQNDLQRRNALMVWQRFGAGKVLQLNFDQSWRLRYGVGDKYHHQFWGQIVRWAVKDRLPIGTDLVRLGLDRMRVQSGEPILVHARLSDPQRNNVIADNVQINVYDEDKIVQQIPLTAESDGGGLLQCEIRDLKKSGKYRLELAGPTVDRLLATEHKAGRKISTQVVVESSSESLEAADLTADPTLPTQLADWTGGKVFTPENADELLKTLGPKSTFERQQWTVPLWNMWPVMVLFLGCLNLEWIMRRFRGLV